MQKLQVHQYNSAAFEQPVRNLAKLSFAAVRVRKEKPIAVFIWELLSEYTLVEDCSEYFCLLRYIQYF